MRFLLLLLVSFTELWAVLPNLKVMAGVYDLQGKDDVSETLSQPRVNAIRSHKGKLWRLPSGIRCSTAIVGSGMLDIEDLPSSQIGVRVTVHPENTPINESPWYAFRIDTSSVKGDIRLEFHYPYGSHRYDPMISTDRRVWKRLTPVTESNGDVHYVLPKSFQPVWVSAQELKTGRELEEWLEKIIWSAPDMELDTAGLSVGRRPIYRMRIGEADARYKLIFMGRQHPPEVGGSIALEEFVATLTEEEGLAKAFRKKFQTIVYPVLNPDGVAHGHWRHNANGVDIGRDWIDFRQPETQALRDDISLFAKENLLFMVDFHSTDANTFYITPEQENWQLRHFQKKWIEAIVKAVPDQEFVLQYVGLSIPVAQTWFASELGIPAMAYEVSDRTERSTIQKTARIAATKLMEELLNEVASAPQ